MGVSKRGVTLVIDFRCYLPTGQRVRCRESEGPDNKKNHKRVQKKWKAIQYHIDQGSFDYLKFFPYGSKAKYFNAVDKSQITYTEFWKEWIEEKAVRRGTLTSYESPYKNHIKPYFGDWPISDITDHDILVFRKTLLDKGIKENTVNQYMVVFCMPLKAAAKRGYIISNPCEEVTQLSEPKVQINPLSFDELSHFLQYLKQKDIEWFDLITFWSQTGLRPGELFALRWDNVDFFNRQVLICEARKIYGEIGPTKTVHSDREISLRPAVIDALNRQKTRTMLVGEFVFLNHNQEPWAATTMHHQFKNRLKLAGLKVRSPKQMRHTFATLHIGAGESISWVSKTLGHADVKTTLDKYNRFIPNLTREDGSAFENVLNGHNLVTRHGKCL